MTALQAFAWLTLALVVWLGLLLANYHNARRTAAYYRQLAQSRGHTITRWHARDLGNIVQQHMQLIELTDELADTRQLAADALDHNAELLDENADLRRRLAQATYPR